MGYKKLVNIRTRKKFVSGYIIITLLVLALFSMVFIVPVSAPEPVITNNSEYPVNNSVGVSLYPVHKINVSDEDNGNMIIWFNSGSYNWQKPLSIIQTGDNKFGYNELCYDDDATSYKDMNATIRGTWFTCPANGTASSIGFKFDDTVPSGKDSVSFKGAIYFKDNITWLKNTSERIIDTDVSSPGWGYLNFTSPYPQLTAGEPYYIVVWGNRTESSSLNFYGNSTKNGLNRSISVAEPYTNNFPHTLNTSNMTYEPNWIYRIFINYSANPVKNGTYYADDFNVKSPHTTYWWSVNVTDGSPGPWTNTTYHFTTADFPWVVTNISTGVEENNATLNGYLQNNGSANTTCGFWLDTISGGTSNSSSCGVVANRSEFSYNASPLTPGQLYYVKAWANNTIGYNTTANEEVFLTKPDPPTDLTATMHNHSTINLTWINGTGAKRTIIEQNQTGSTWARGQGTVIYNGTGTSCENVTLSENTTYYYQAWSYTDWTYDSTILQQWSDTNATDYNRTNAIPTITNPTPGNGSTGRSLTPLMNITVNDYNGDNMIITWYSNRSGPWVVFGTTNTTGVNGNGTYRQTNSNFDEYNYKYYWRVNVTDGKDTNSTWFYFRTREAPSSPPSSSPPSDLPPTITNINRTPLIVTNNITVTISATVTDDHNVSNVTLYWKDGTTLSEFMTQSPNNIYSATIDPYPDGTKITYWIIAMDNANQPARSSDYNYTVVDKRGPNITPVSPNSTYPIYDTTPFIQANYQDPSGIDTTSVTMTVDTIPVAATITNESVTYLSTTPLANGSHTVKVTAADTHNNFANITWSFTIAPSESQATENIGNTTAGENMTVMPANAAQTGISTISFTTTTNLSNVTLTVTGLHDIPEEIPPPKNVTIYQYFDLTLTTDNLPVTEDELSSLLITFEVPKSWLQEHKITNDTAWLMHYHNHTWSNLTTILINESNTSKYFEANVYNLSTFAIVGSQIKEIKTESPLPEIPLTMIIGVIVIATILLIIVLFKAGYIYREEEKPSEDQPKKPPMTNDEAQK
jgi:PGF-pre-PGF domain-containing protein